MFCLYVNVLNEPWVCSAHGGQKSGVRSPRTETKIAVRNVDA